MADQSEASSWGAAHYRVLVVLYLSYFANVFGRTAVQVSFPLLQGQHQGATDRGFRGLT